MSFASIQITGIDSVKKLFLSLPVESARVLQMEFMDAANIVSYKIKEEAPVDQSQLKGSVSVKEVGKLNAEVVASSIYAPYMEWGTKDKARVPSYLSQYASQFKGKSPEGGTDPIVALTAWVRRKGITKKVGKDDELYKIKGKRSNRKQRETIVAERIFWEIIRYGVKPHPFFFTDKSGTDRRPWIIEQLKTSLENAIKKLKR